MTTYTALFIKLSNSFMSAYSPQIHNYKHISIKTQAWNTARSSSRETFILLISTIPSSYYTFPHPLSLLLFLQQITSNNWARVPCVE